MLKKITLNNYRSHEQTAIELHPHVNVIVGRGQAGKTNIMRGFETLRSNRPNGFKYHSWFTDDPTEIIVETGDGHVVGFYKNDKGAWYTLDDHEPYRKVGTKVPGHISQVLNMTDLNMQWQHDSPYLLTGGAGQIGKAINAVIDFEELDKWITDINSRRTKLTTEKTIVKKQLEDAEAELAGLTNLKAAGDILAEAEQLETAIQTKYNTTHSGEGHLTHGRALKTLLDKCNATMAAEEPYHQAEQIQWGIDKNIKALALAQKAKDAYELATAAAKRYRFLRGKYLKAIQDAKVCPTCFYPINPATLKRIKEQL